MTEEQMTKEMEFLTNIVEQICNFAVDNGLEPNDTLETISQNLHALCLISDFNNWKKED